MNSLFWLFIIPFIASGILFLLPIRKSDVLKPLAIGLSFIPLLVLLFSTRKIIGTDFNYPWLPALSIQFHLHVDSISLLFLYLTALIIPISLFSMPSLNLANPNAFYGLILLLEGLLIGFFTARDLALFTIFWEAMLLPLYFIINIWGGERRQHAALKFLLYMIAGSTLMIAGVLALYFASGSQSQNLTFDMDALKGISVAAPYSAIVCGVFLLAFAVKTPLFPFHAWLPDAYYQAPVAGTILLSALLSKAGIYGILRIGFEIFPQYLREWGPFLLILAIAGVFYGGLAAWMQKDFKKLIAYSSLSHVNFVLVGLFVWNQTAHEGAILQAINHGVTIAGLFLVAGWLEQRLGSTLIGKASGLAKFLPHLCWLTLFFVLSSIALPGLNNFIGEILIFFGLFKQNPWLTAFLGLTIILSVIYMLRWMQLVYFEAPVLFQESWIDIKIKELAVALPLVALILWIGIYPEPVLKQITPFTEKVLSQPGITQ